MTEPIGLFGQETQRDLTPVRRGPPAWLLIGLGLTLLVTGLHWWCLPSNPDAQAYAEWCRKPLAVPAAALHAEPFDAETVRAAHAFREEWIWVRTRHTNAGWDERPFPLEDPQLHQELEPYQPALAALARLVRRPDFEWNAIHCDLPYNLDSVIPVVDYGEIRQMLGLLGWQAADQARQGRLAEALDGAALWARGARVAPFEPSTGKLVAYGVLHQALAAWGALVAECQDPALLRRTLQDQQELAESLHDPRTGLSEGALYHLWILRELQRRGLSVKLPTLSEAHLYGACLQAQATFLETRILPERGHGEQGAMLEGRLCDLRAQAQLYQRAGSWFQASRRVFQPNMDIVLQTHIDANETHLTRQASQVAQALSRLRQFTAERLEILKQAGGPEI